MIECQTCEHHKIIRCEYCASTIVNTHVSHTYSNSGLSTPVHVARTPTPMTAETTMSGVVSDATARPDAHSMHLEPLRMKSLEQTPQRGPEYPRAHSAAPVPLPPGHARAPMRQSRTTSESALHRYEPGLILRLASATPVAEQSSRFEQAWHSPSSSAYEPASQRETGTDSTPTLSAWMSVTLTVNVPVMRSGRSHVPMCCWVVAVYETEHVVFFVPSSRRRDERGCVRTAK